MTNGDESAVWTTDTDNVNTVNSVNNVSRVSTASAKHQKEVLIKNIINNNNGKAENPDFVGVQSRFRRKYYHKSVLVLLIVVIMLLSISVWIVARNGKYKDNLCKSKDCLRAASNLLQSMDFTADPCDDFYQFTCGNWAEDHPRPDSSNSFDWFSERQTKVLRYIRSFLQRNSTRNDPGAVNQTRVMYQACMNTGQMDANGLRPVVNYLSKLHLPSYPSVLYEEITADKSPAKLDWIQSVAAIKRIFGADVIIGFDIFPDPTNRTRNRIVLGTPETDSVLPFKTEYEKKLLKLRRKRISELVIDDFVTADDTTDEESGEKKISDPETIQAYSMYITEVISAFVFDSNPSVNMEKILPAIKESATKVIKITKHLIELSDEAENSTEPAASNGIGELLNLSLDDFQNSTDRLIAPKTLPIWHRYLSILFEDVPNADFVSHLILSSTADMYYLEHLILYIFELPALDLELYIWWTIVEKMVLHTTTDIRKLHNEYAKSITNLEGSTPRSLYCTSGVNQLMGLPVSYAIVEPNFLVETKPKIMLMINNIRKAFENLVLEINWMDAGTKCSTLLKSRAMRSFVGFPEWILKPGKLDEHYAGLEFNVSTHLKNMIDVLTWQMTTKLNTINETEEIGWATAPTNVNAFHTFQANAITVPLAILQYPFYNLGLEALNYGAIGTILGHELTHGFDDSGRMFDKDGNIRQWWTNKTTEEYINRTECFIKQYSSYYIPEVDRYVDGEFTLGENIADNGGLREAYYAYKLYEQSYGQELMLPGLEQFTHEQLLFVSFGNLWCETQTTVATKWALEDSHCPGNIRLRGVLENSNEFRQAFGCTPNSKMYTNKQCRIW